MPSSFLTLFPGVLGNLEALKFSLRTGVQMTESGMDFFSNALDMTRQFNALAMNVFLPFTRLPLPVPAADLDKLREVAQECSEDVLKASTRSLLDPVRLFHRERCGELEFIKFLTEDPPDQDWTEEYDTANVMLDLPSMRVVDITRKEDHAIQNYTVVFAPRAGHHSNIAERVALFLRDQGLTRMAVVEQKCAEAVPLSVGDRRHSEGFPGQVAQYREVLLHLKNRTGFPAHAIAVCQPGPLLISTLILNPELGKTFGSAGSPMHTEAETGFFTEFSRAVGEPFIDFLVDAFGFTVPDDRPGAGRKVYDGRMHLLGFYLMGMDQHVRNFKKLLTDLKEGDEASARRQQVFYQWYNYVHHFPAGFIRDTYKQVFVRNDLIRGGLRIGDRKVDIADFPESLPVWALGGAKDDIAPAGQATGHLDMMAQLPDEKKLKIICEAGHMGLFRSRKILSRHYTRIAEFMLSHSDPVIDSDRIDKKAVPLN